MVEEFMPTMSEVRVNKDELLDILIQNRREHRQAFSEAVEGYRTKAVEKLERTIGRIAANDGIVEIQLGLVVPREHTKDYDQAIKTLQLSRDDEVFLTQQEFAQYVMDDWGWQQEFTATNVMYSGR